MIGAVWYENAYNGQAEFQRIIDDYKRREINVVRETYNGYKDKPEMMVVFENGDSWHLLNAFALHCGRRTNVIYVERTIPRDIYRQVILPCQIGSPYCGIHLYGEGERWIM